MDCCSKQRRKEPSEHVFEEQQSGTLLESGTPSADRTDQRSKEQELEDHLIQTIKKGNFENIENEIKPRAFKYCESNSLLMGMKVNYELCRLADSKGPDENRFNQLANSVEEFTTTMLDPLRSNQRRREEFGDDLDEILEDAIRLEQKKFFTHPVVDTEMKRKWHGREFMKTEWKRWQLLFSIWCLFDLVFSPFLYAIFSLIRTHMENKRRKKKSSGMELKEAKQDGGAKEKRKKAKPKKYLSAPEIYLITLDTPYFKFVRDTLSYIVLLALHYALCLSPSTIRFSGLEWTILIFFIGRYLVERKQICDVLQHLRQQRESGDDGTQSKCLPLKALWIYQSDLWNRLDFVSLVLYLIIMILRVTTLIMSGSVVNNRVLVIAGYLYSFNTLCLTFRVIGHVMEQSRDVGTIQIALFSILKDISAVIWQFTAAILAFSIAITKVYMAEKSFIANGSDDNVCKKSGISCWWAITTYLGWSLLGVSEDFDPMNSVDFPSEILARILYAGFLIMGVVLLINMLIALLSNTYQRIQDNSLKEWSFKTAVTIQTYDGYDPIPVPLNILYSIAKLLKLVRKKEKVKGAMLYYVVIDLDREYFEKHGNFFPLTDEKKDDLVIQETRGNRQLISQILNTTFQFIGAGDHGTLRPGPEAWQVHSGIRIEGHLLTCDGMEYCEECERRPGKKHWPGARHRTSFSPEFPHFEVAILETGKQIMMAIGVVTEGYNTAKMPGWENGTVGYYTDGSIFDAENNYYGRPTKGPAVAVRGDRIRCTVMFENAQERDGKIQVPIFFTLNGKKIIIRDGGEQVFMDSDKPLYPYIGMTDGCSVLAKLCSRENEEQQVHMTDDVSKKVTNMEKSLQETNQKLDALLARLTNQEQAAHASDQG